MVTVADPPGGAGDSMSVYDVTGDPLLTGASHAAVRVPSPKPVQRGAPGASGTASGRAGAEGGLGSDQSTALRAATVKVYSTSFVRPAIVQVVLAHGVTTPPGVAVTRYPVIGSPRWSGASQDRTTVPSRTSPTRGAAGVAGLPRTRSAMPAETSRAASSVASRTRTRTTICPTRSSAGRSTTLPPDTDAVPAPGVSTVTPTTRSGSSGNGLYAPASTSTTRSRPCTPSPSSRLGTTATRRVLAMARTSTWTSIVDDRPYPRVRRTVPRLPLGVPTAEATLSRLPDSVAVKPAGWSPASWYVYVCAPDSSSTPRVYASRSTTTGASPGATSTGAGSKVGG